MNDAFNSCLDLLGFHLEMAQIHARNELQSFHMQIMESVRALVRIKTQSPTLHPNILRETISLLRPELYFCSTILQIV